MSRLREHLERWEPWCRGPLLPGYLHEIDTVKDEPRLKRTLLVGDNLEPVQYSQESATPSLCELEVAGRDVDADRLAPELLRGE